jgi:hypothetical protein
VPVGVPALLLDLLLRRGFTGELGTGFRVLIPSALPVREFPVDGGFPFETTFPFTGKFSLSDGTGGEVGAVREGGGGAGGWDEMGA